MALDLDTGLLRVFLVCTRLGSIGRAAQSLGRTQPALSQQLRRLEDLVGETLFLRAAKGVSLTTAGAALVPYAERILALSGEALAGVPRSRLSGRCSLGMLEDFTGTVLPAAFADFCRMHTDITLELVSLPSSETQAALDRGRIQLALCEAAYLREEPRWQRRVPMHWVAAENFDISTDPLPLVLFSEPCQWRHRITSALTKAGRAYRTVFETGSLTALQSAVRAGLGVTTMLPIAIAPGLDSQAAGAALPALSDVDIGLARQPESEGSTLTDAVEEMLKLLV